MLLLFMDIATDASGPLEGDAAAVAGNLLPYARAFVVQFTSETDVRLEKAEGRIEHMQSGRRARFASTEELLASLTRLLADDPGTRASGDP